MIAIDIFEENHRLSETTPNPAPRSIVRAANLAASSRGSRTTFAVCDLIVRTEQEVKMANLYVFHHGWGLNGQLWYSVFDGKNWAPDRQVPNVGISGSPSAVVYPGRGIYVFHQGYDPKLVSDELWYSFFDGTNWAPDTRVPNVGVSEEPSAVVFPGGGMSVFHRGNDVSGTLWYSYFDGENWAPDRQVPNVRMERSPSAVVLPGGGISVFHQRMITTERFGTRSSMAETGRQIRMCRTLV
jgi:hypothetical protein